MIPNEIHNLTLKNLNQNFTVLGFKTMTTPKSHNSKLFWETWGTKQQKTRVSNKQSFEIFKKIKKNSLSNILKNENIKAKQITMHNILRIC